MDLMAITPGNVDQSVDASLRWLAKQRAGRWMLFFDNADDVQLRLKNFFPASTSGNILVTTRNQALRLYAKDSSENVRDMDHEDATNLLLDLSRAEETDENRVLATQIVQVFTFILRLGMPSNAMIQELRHFALTVSQAAAFIHCNSSLRTYQELYRLERDHLLQTAEVNDPDPYTLAVYATWRLSYDKLDEPARTFLQICSMLHHEGISEQMFKNAALCSDQLEDSTLRKEVTRILEQLGKKDSHWSSWEFQQVVKRLRSYSLIEYDDRNCMYSVHPLVQHWSGTVGRNGEDMKKCVLGIVGLSISWTNDKEDYVYRRGLYKHITNCVALMKPRDVDPLVAFNLAFIYIEQRRWRDAEVYGVVAIKKRRQMLGEDHPDTLSSMESLASIYRNQGRLKDAEMLGVAVMEKRKELLGEDHPDTLTSMGNLASIYWNQGRLMEAEVLEVAVMEKRKELLGEDHPDTLFSMGNLAMTYRYQGRLKDAEVLEGRSWKKRKELLGENHPDTLESMGNLASIYRNQGRLKDAEVLEVAVMEKRKELLGEDHPDTLLTMGNLAMTYRKQDRLKDAEVLEVVVMEKRKELLGEDHPETLSSMGNLANTYSDLGRLKDAEVLWVAVMEKRKELLGEDHPDSLAGMGNLASIYRKQGRLKDAEVLEVAVMEKTKELLGEDHPDTLLSMENLAMTYRKQGRLKDAEVLVVAVMEKRTGNQLD